MSKNSKVPVLLRVTVNGLRTDASTNLKVNPDLWHSALGKSLVAKLKNYILEHHKYVKEQVTIQQEKINARLERIENLLNEQQAKRGILERFEQWIRSI